MASEWNEKSDSKNASPRDNGHEGEANRAVRLGRKDVVELDAGCRSGHHG